MKNVVQEFTAKTDLNTEDEKLTLKFGKPYLYLQILNLLYV